MTTIPRRPLGRVLHRALRLLCAAAIVMGLVQMPVSSAFAAGDYPGGADLNPPQYVLNDHTPYAVHFSATGLTPSTTLNVNVRLSKTGTAGGFTDARGFTWNQSLTRWVQTREVAANFPSITTDASGNASGWVYWKLGDETFTGWGAGYPPLGANQGFLTVSLQTPTGGGTFNGLNKWVVNIVDSDAQGAWVHNGVASGAAAAKRAEALQSTDASVSYSLQKTEPNVLDDDSNGVVDDENYGPAVATGDFRFGVPASSIMNVKLNQVAWASGTGATAGPADTDIALGAADQTAPEAVSGLVATPLDSSVKLDWTAATDSGGSGLSAYKVFRMVPGTWGDLTLQSASPLLVGTVAAGTTTFTDTSLTNGTAYSYYVKAQDTDTNVGPRSSLAAATPILPDTTAPAAVTDLTVAGTAETTAALTWTAPGDDGSVGTASSYDLRYSEAPIGDDTAFSAATPVSGVPAPQAAGSAEAFTVTGLTNGTHYYFALKTADEVPNWSALSNQADGSTDTPPTGTMSVNGGASSASTTT
ncbi:MAG: hypothetical protein WCI74_13070, partial [Actinomycetes bacterium]